MRGRAAARYLGASATGGVVAFFAGIHLGVPPWGCLFLALLTFLVFHVVAEWND